MDRPPTSNPIVHTVFNNLSKQTEECIYELKGECNIHNTKKCSNHTNTTCPLPNNLSFTILKLLGVGRSGVVYLVDILGEHYAIKICSYLMHTEYHVLSTIDIERELNIPHIHPIASFLYQQFRHESVAIDIQSFDDIDGGIIHFFIKCYRDIITIFDKLYTTLHAFYWDIALANLLFDTVNHKCYVIDMQSIIYSKIEQFQPKQHGSSKLYCHHNTCPPFIYYTFRSIKQRIEYKATHKNLSDAELVALFDKHSAHQSRYQILSHILTIFVKYYGKIVRNLDEQRIIKKAIRTLSAHRSQPASEKLSMPFVWCSRLEVIQQLKYNTSNLDAAEKDDSIKHEFW
eukprot:1082304_1